MLYLARITFKKSGYSRDRDSPQLHPLLQTARATSHQPVGPTESRLQFTSDQLLTVQQPTRSAARYFGHVRPAHLPSFRSNQRAACLI